MRIAHISDLHICSRYRTENIIRTEQLLKYAYMEDVDHLIISGDISHDSAQEDFIIFRDLLKKYGFLDSSKASICIGNHDIYGGVHLATDIINFPTRCKTTSMIEKVKSFSLIFSELFRNTKLIHADNPFPFVKELSDVIIFGLNTNMNYSFWRNPMASNGKLESEEWEQIKMLLSDDRNIDGKRKIVVTHHHFNHENKEQIKQGNLLWQIIEKLTMRLYRNGRLARLFSKNDVALVMHGHVHYNEVYKLNNVTYSSAGGSVESDIKDDNCNINMIDLDKNNVNVQIVAIEPPRIEPKLKPIYILPEFNEMQPELAHA